MNKHNFSSSLQDEDGLLSGRYWGELRIFAEVARAKSFNRAAERLGVSQPTIGRKVRRLQDLMGTQLCVATKHGVRLTRRGEELASVLLKLDQSLFSIASDIRARDKDAEGVVSMSITDGLAAFFAAPAVAGFSHRFPKIQLHIKSMGNLNDLRENRTDMMLTFAPMERSDVVSRAIGSLHFVPIASRGYIEQYGMPTRDRIGKHLFLQSFLYESDAPTWHDWQALCAKGTIVHHCDNPFAYAMLVKQNLGIGLLGAYVARERTAVVVDLGLQATVQLYAVVLAERLESRPVALTFDWLCATFGETNPWFHPRLDIASLPKELPLPPFGLMLYDQDDSV